MTFTKGTEHDRGALRAAREFLDEHGGGGAAARVHELVRRNGRWRGQKCVNLIAAESPTSPAVRALLSSEIGTRASGGHIGADSRCFPGLRHADEVEALCVELLKEAFRAGWADQRMLGGMAGCMVAYTALARPGDLMMSVPPPAGGDSSGRADGPGGARGLRVADIPFDLDELEVDLDAFRREAERLRPRLVSLNQTMVLFPLPVRELKEIVAPWGGRLYFDGAHQAGLIAGGCHPNPLDEGADILTGSSGKTFSGPQGGIIAWNDPDLTEPVSTAIFPVLTGSHQMNRVAALAVATAEMLEFGAAYMRQTVANARSFARSLADQGFAVLCGNRGYTRTHQVMVDVRSLGGGLAVARTLEEANIMVNKMLLPSDPDSPDAEPGGIRIGTTEVTRLGFGEAELDAVARLMRRALIEREPVSRIRRDVEDLRSGFQTLHYTFGAGAPRTHRPTETAESAEPADPAERAEPAEPAEPAAKSSGRTST